jgi:pimeloyl-ACP methyl ester carboxylesterase
MPISDPGLGASEYAAAVVAAIGRASEPVVVGHSMAGLVIPLVAAMQPVHRLVFLAAFMAQPGRSANQQREGEPIDGRVPLATAEWTDLGRDVWAIGSATAGELFYHDVPADLAAWATSRLRPQSYAVFSEPCPLASWPVVPADAIVCRDDRAINPEWVRSAARQRLGVEAREIEGGHSPFLTRPVELARILDAIIRQEP